MTLLFSLDYSRPTKIPVVTPVHTISHFATSLSDIRAFDRDALDPSVQKVLMTGAR